MERLRQMLGAGVLAAAAAGCSGKPAEVDKCGAGLDAHGHMVISGGPECDVMRQSVGVQISEAVLTHDKQE